MKPPSSKERTIATDSTASVREGMPGTDSLVTQSLPLAEIESLLRLARENVHKPPNEEPDEDLGPGDVQHLRGDSTRRTISTKPPTSLSGLSESSSTPDSLLQQAEKHLADALLNSESVRSSPASKSIDAALPRVPSVPRLTPRPGLTLEDLGDVDLDISIELGRAEILIEDVLKLREGSVVSLDKLAGDPVDIVANGRLVARGELLVIDGKFGVRLSEVL